MFIKRRIQQTQCSNKTRPDRNWPLQLPRWPELTPASQEDLNCRWLVHRQRIVMNSHLQSTALRHSRPGGEAALPEGTA